MTEGSVDYVSAPKDYNELFLRYYDFVVLLVRRMGIDDNSKEDVASTILTRFWERDFLHVFDPTMVFHYNGQDRPARFKSFLSKFVIIYVRSHREKQRYRSTKELLLCDAPVGEGEDCFADVFCDQQVGPEDDVADSLDERDVVTYLRQYLAEVPRRSRGDVCDLVLLFDRVVAQIHARGCYDVNELKDVYGLSATAMHSWMWWLRENLADALGRPVPAKRHRVVAQR